MHDEALEKDLINFTIDDPEDPEGENNHQLFPTRATTHSAGHDLKTREKFVIHPGEVKLITTGVYLNFTSDRCCGLVLPRSGMAVKQGVTVLNSPGLIDPDYTGEIKVALIYHGIRARDGWRYQPSMIAIEKYQRIAQLVIVPTSPAGLVYAAEPVEFNFHSRGSGGFGSTGNQ